MLDTKNSAISENLRRLGQNKVRRRRRIRETAMVDGGGGRGSEEGSAWREGEERMQRGGQRALRAGCVEKATLGLLGCYWSSPEP